MYRFNQNNLSLKNWPKKPVESRYTQLSPLTSHILNKQRINPNDLLPISFEYFATTVHKKYSYGIIRILYSQQCIKKAKKLEQLKILYQRQKQKGVKLKKSSSKSKERSKQKVRKSQKFKSIKNSPHILAKSTRHSRNDYWSFNQDNSESKRMFFGRSSHKNIPLTKLVYQDQSTRSKRLMKQSTQYYATINSNKKPRLTHINKRNKTKTIKSKSLKKTNQDILQNIGELLQVYMKVLNQQRIQMQKYRTLSSSILDKRSSQTEVETQKYPKKQTITERQRRRLQKIHRIQKQQLRNRIEDIRCQFNKFIGKTHNKKTMKQKQIHNIHDNIHEDTAIFASHQFPQQKDF